MVNFAAEMQRQGFDHPAADRRGDDLARPHRGQGRPEVRRPGRLGQGRLALGADRRGAAAATTARPKLMADVQGRLRLAADAPRGQARPAAGHAGAGARATPRRSTGRATTRRVRTCCSSRTTGLAHRRLAATTQHVRVFRDDLRPATLHRLAAVLQRLGDEGRASPTSSTTRSSGEAARKLYDDAQAMLDRIDRRDAG